MVLLGARLGLLPLVAAQLQRWYQQTDYPGIPEYGPQPAPDYMVDNQNNWFKTAPDKGRQNGAVWLDSGSFEEFMERPHARRPVTNSTMYNHTIIDSTGNATELEYLTPIGFRLASTGYWLPELADKGLQPIAGSNYKFYRNVLDYNADPTGDEDTTEAINAAIEDGGRCGLECGNTFAMGAIIYFPPGIYKICRPIIQLYYTQFIGDPLNMPTIKGCDTFQGIALIDTDPYIPGGNGANWYINQNQFFRQIRNFIFDMTDMPLTTDDHDQALVPTGIHWQVSQACSLQNLVFNMPRATDDDRVTHVGIFTENGSGGFVSDLTFIGGRIGWRAGSQQYTAMNLYFYECLTAVQMVWDWGFNWQRIEVDGGAIAFNISGRGGDTGQGIGSISLIDSSISNCPIGILTNSRSGAPSIVIDNLETRNVAAIVQDDDGNTILAGSRNVDLWAIGRRYDGYEGTYRAGPVTAPAKGSRLLDGSGKLFYRPKPDYSEYGAGQFRVATDHGCRNDGTGDNTAAINTFLREAQAAGEIAYFPAGIYRVGATVLIPTGSRVIGSSWSQIQGAGAYFSDVHNPRVVVQVGNRGDVGTMEIVDMMFNVQGATAGAIILEWNVHESSQGSAAMWDSHVRVGGATGSDLDIDTCPKFGFNDACICAAMLFHVTPQASGYFENVWIWLADHDNDMVVTDSPDKLINQISLYAARGTLIESEGPTWLYGTGSEHVIFYQYQVYGAKDVYLGHIQTETPYYQPNPVAPLPYDVGRAFPGDPSFEHCTTIGCQEAWGLRIIDSEGVFLHGSGMYSFFQDYYQDCIPTHNCQERLLEVRGSKDVAFFNIFTVATEEIGTGINNGAIFQNDSNQSGFTTEVSVWIPLEGDDDLNVVYVGPEVYDDSQVTCPAPCVLVFPTSSLSSATTISPGRYTTSVEYGRSATTTVGGQVIVTFITTTTTITLSIDPITTDALQYSNVNITRGQTSSTLRVSPSVDIPPVAVPLPDGEGGTTTRTLTLPPWPAVTRGPPEEWDAPGSPGETVSGVFRTPFVTTVTATGATVTTISFPSIVSAITVSCPTETQITFATPRTTITTECEGNTVLTLGFTCPATRIVTFVGSSTGVLSADCTLSTAFDPVITDEPLSPPPINTNTEELPVWTTWPVGGIIPIPERVDRPEPDEYGHKTPCSLWFFSICLRNDDVIIGGLLWLLPPGIYGPIGWDRVPTYSSQEPTSCQTSTASICSTGVTESITTTGTSTSTITSTASSCDSFTGCAATDWETIVTTTTSPPSCPLPTPGPNAPPAPPGCPANAVVYPANPRRVGEIPRLLADYQGDYVEIKSSSLGLTSFFWVPFLDKDTMDALLASPDVKDAYYYGEFNRKVGPFDPYDRVIDLPLSESEEFSSADDDDSSPSLDAVPTNEPEGPAPELHKRAVATHTHQHLWYLSQVSMPKGKVWDRDDSEVKAGNDYVYRYDNSSDTDANRADSWVYVVHEQGYWRDHDEIINKEGTIEDITPDVEFGHPPNPDRTLWAHGTAVVSKIVGARLGICRKCNVVFIGTANDYPRNPEFGDTMEDRVGERVLKQLYDALDHIVDNGRVGKAVINMSFGYPSDKQKLAFFDALYDVLELLDRVAKAVLVVASGNDAIITRIRPGTENNPIIERDPQYPVPRPIHKWPASFGNPNGVDLFGYLPNLIVVGMTDRNTQQVEKSQFARWLTTYAPGGRVAVPRIPTPGQNDGLRTGNGTSYAAPQVAGLAAYFRSVDSPWRDQLTEPSHVKRLITLFHRRFAVHREGNPNDDTAPNPNDPLLRRPVIWNGQVGEYSCLTHYNTRHEWDTDGVCPTINQYLSHETRRGESVRPCGSDGLPVGPRRRLAQRQDEEESCPWIPGDGSGGDSHNVEFSNGPEPSPTCASGTGCGGRLCTGFFCEPSPTGVPPGRRDPKDPNAGNPVPTTSIPDPPRPTTRPPGTTTTRPQEPEPTCDDRCKLDRGNACNCGESGCDEGSPSCCANASCPDCVCGESGCSSSSPACCASGTCRWSWTGGGGGDGTGQPPGPQPNPDFENGFFYIALSEIFTNGVYRRSWDVISAPHNSGVDLCFDRPDLSEDAGSATGNNPGFPPSLGPFRSQGRTCRYSGTRSAVGTLTCDGIRRTRCIEYEYVDNCFPLNNRNLYAVVKCEW